jgi:hypothetical protein
MELELGIRKFFTKFFKILSIFNALDEQSNRDANPKQYQTLITRIVKMLHLNFQVLYQNIIRVRYTSIHDFFNIRLFN